MKRILLVAALLISIKSLGQQSAHYTQYIFNGLVINPAYVGSKELINVNGIYRSQWTGLEGSPSTQTLSIDGAVLKNRVGVGMHVINDQIGAQGQKSFYANTAVRLKISNSAKLAFGVAGGASQYYLDGTRLNPTDGINDNVIPQSMERSMLPDAKAGIFLNTERFYLGASAFNLIRFRNKFVATPTRHYFLTSGYVFDLNDMLKFKPSFLIKEDFKSPTNVDLNAFLLIGDRVWLGGSYRTSANMISKKEFRDQDLTSNNAWALMTEIYLSPKIKLGYSHDVTLTSLREYASHELSIGFYFFKKEESRTLTIRYF